MDSNKIEISHRTIIFTLFLLVLVWITYQIREVILLVFVSLILTGALNPTIDRIEKWRIPRWLAILLVYSVIVLIFGGGLAGVVPTLVEQTENLGAVLESLIIKLNGWGFSSDTLRSQLQELGSLPSEILKLSISVFSNILSVFVVFVVTFYLLMEHKKLDKHLFFLFGGLGKNKASGIVKKLENKLGGWVRAQLILMFIVGLFSYLGYWLVGLKFALPLAILAALFEVIPNVGPTLAGFLAALIGLLRSPATALMVGAWAIIVQQLENNFFVPKVMQKSVGVNPLATILSLTIGFKLAGIVGAIMAIPVYLALEIIILETVLPLWNGKRSLANKAEG